MKKSICFIFVLLSFFFGPSALAADSSALEISTPEQLFELNSNPFGHFSITADIDMTGFSWDPRPFFGTLDGNGHTIYNLSVSTVSADVRTTVDGNDKTYDTVFAGLFSTLEGAQIQDLELRGARICIESNENVFIGSFAGYICDSQLTNCHVQDSALSLSCGGHMNGIGGLVGFGSGAIQNCSVDIIMTFVDSDPIDRCEQFMGGILACGNTSISNCAVTLQGYDNCSGYVHNGGLVGMFYQYDKAQTIGSIYETTVTGAVHFYENNPDRRAYCAAFIGEPLTVIWPMGCSSTFDRDETWNYSAVLQPEKCSEPQYITDTITAHCSGWGYTIHTCSICSNTWKDSFTPAVHGECAWETVTPATYETGGQSVLRCADCHSIIDTKIIAPHIAGEWCIIEAPDYTHTGMRCRYCTDCGDLLNEEVLPALIPASECVLNTETLSLHYKDTFCLTSEILPVNVSAPGCRWESSDSSVIQVSSDGTLFANGRGSAVVSCTSDDGFAASSCEITVTYSFRQWLIITLLFGWLWY